jgi:hypothetical protein
MTTPMRPVPHGIQAWVGRRRWLRGGDAFVAWVLLGAGVLVVVGAGRLQAAAVVAAVLVAAGGMIQPLRVRWRPVSAWVGVRLSQGFRPGDRAWYVGAREAHLVVVTARHGVRLVIVRPDLDRDEGISVRCTRVFLLPADRR